jgi:hypothetical protein
MEPCRLAAVGCLVFGGYAQGATLFVNVLEYSLLKRGSSKSFVGFHQLKIKLQSVQYDVVKVLG